MKGIENNEFFSEITNNESANVNGGYYSCGYRYQNEVVLNRKTGKYVIKPVLKWRCHWV